MNDVVKMCWENSISFHGHACPGLAIGVRAALIAKEIIEIDENMQDEDVVCLAETDACGIDGIQVILKATMGSGSLRVDYKGKNAYSFFNRKNSKSVRIVFKGMDKDIDRAKRMELILNSPIHDYFEIKPTKIEFPNRAIIYSSQSCTICGEKTAENALKNINGNQYCLDCFKEKL